MSRLFLTGFLAALASLVALARAPAQPPAVPGVAQLTDNNDPEVLARGPIHEAFAATAEQPSAGDIAPKGPPDPIEELPPDQKPEGDNVQWIPGYWSWDAERMDFIWISGFWRQPPPNHVWVPGSWHGAGNGYQWTSGFWQLHAPNQPAAPEIEYLPTPPSTVETGPAVPQPDPTSVYVSGSWVWRGRYVWRPGFWVASRPNWIWTPAHYRWTPLGYVFIEGYWDYPLATRGVLFTPVYFPRRAFAAGYAYTPAYVIAEQLLFGALFVRTGHSSYYFGDYYDPAYLRGGYTPWCAPALRGTVAAIPARGGWRYDPLWSYYSAMNRQTPQWSTNVTRVYAGRYDGTMARPPRTLVQQNQAIQRVTNVTNVKNVTNSISVVNNNITVNNTNVSQHVMVAPLAITPKLQPQTKLQPITPQVRQAEVKHAADLRQVAVARQKTESAALKARPPIAPPQPGTPPTPHQAVKLKVDVPKTVITRSAVAEQKKQPPPPPVHPMVDHKVEPPKFVPMPPLVPKIDPKPKVDPKNPAKVDPKNPPKTDPKDPKKTDPKDPKKKD
jgi:hypothetical protein